MPTVGSATVLRCAACPQARVCRGRTPQRRHGGCPVRSEVLPMTLVLALLLWCTVSFALALLVGRVIGSADGKTPQTYVMRPRGRNLVAQRVGTGARRG